MGAITKFPLQSDFLNFRSNVERDSYFLGLFFADGYNSETRGNICIRLQGRDKEFLQSVSDNIYVNSKPLYHVICDGRDYYEISISNRSLSQKLANLGAKQAKSLILDFPKNKGINLRHFIRGYFDGDGSCSAFQRKIGKTKTRQVTFAGTKIFLQKMNKIIQQETGLEFKLLPVGKIYISYLNGSRRIAKFATWLYNCAQLFLPRKRQRFLELNEDLQSIDSKKTYVFFLPRRNRWIARTPSLQGRKRIGSFISRKDALKAVSKFLVANL